MPFEIARREVTFPMHKGDGPQGATVQIHFSRPVSQAFAMLEGFSLEFGGGDDHQLALATAHLSVADLPAPSQDVTVIVHAGWTDNGNWDDNYKAWVSFVVLGITV